MPRRKRFRRADQPALGFCDDHQQLRLLRTVEFERLVTFMSQQCNGGSIWQIVAVDLNHAVVYFAVVISMVRILAPRAYPRLASLGSQCCDPSSGAVPR